MIVFLATGLTTVLYAQKDQSMTLKLVWQFHEAWNAEDLKTMEHMLHVDAFFKSPFQLRYGRDSMMATVLRRNPGIFKVTRIEETRSLIDDQMAWSIGTMLSDVYDEEGEKQEKPWHNEYLYVFVKDRKGRWKLKMLVYHE